MAGEHPQIRHCLLVVWHSDSFICNSKISAFHKLLEKLKVKVGSSLLFLLKMTSAGQ